VLDALPALVFSLALMLINPVIILARLSSPDALSNLFLFGSFYRIYFRKGRGWTVFLLLCALFIRLDNLLAALVLLTLMRCLPSRDGQAVFPPAAYLLSILLICAAGIWINYYFESDFSWYRRIGYIQSPSSYGLQVLVYFLSLSQSFFMALLLLCLLVLFKGRLHRRTAQAYILLGIAAIFFLRFVLFPSFEERFQAAFYLPATLILLELLLSESGKGLPGGRYGPEPAG
jgi:hypothetical protein